MTDIITEAENAVKALVHDAEELFPPRPGGLVDRHRRRKAAEDAAREAGAATEAEELGRARVRAIRVTVQAADTAAAQCVLLTAAQPVARLLPRDEHRRSAVILAIDNDVYIASDPGTAASLQGGAAGTAGFYLPAGTPVPVASGAELWAAATTTASSSRVSVLSFRESGGA